MSDADYNPFLKRNAPPVPPSAADAELDELTQELQQVTAAIEADHGAVTLPYQFEFDGNKRFSKWFWSFAAATVVVGLIFTVIIKLVIAPQVAMGLALLISALLGAFYGAIHATRKLAKLCRAIHVDYDAIRLTYGKQDLILDPSQVDAVMALSGIDFNGEERGFSSLRSLAILTGAKAEKLGFETHSNRRIFTALREACVHAWAIPEEGGLLPPLEIAEHHAERAGIDSLRRLRKYYGQFVMRLAFSSLAIIGLMAGGVTLALASMGADGLRRIRGGGIKLLFLAGGVVLAALSGLRRLPREWGVLRKIKDTEKSLAVALGLDFAR